MGDHWWLLFVGAGMWAVMIGTAVFGRKRSKAGACPGCGHEAGVDEKHCADTVPDFGGWQQNEPCRCTRDYHWHYESVRS